MPKAIINGIEVNNQKDITAEMMLNYIATNSPKDKEWFKEVSMAEMIDTTWEIVKDKDGNPVYENYVITKGKNKGKTGKRQKRKAIKTGKVKRFNITRARAEFCKKYFPELCKREKSLTEMLKDW